MKLNRLFYLATISSLLFTISCSKEQSNRLKERNYPGRGVGNISQRIRCQAGFGPNRIISHLRAQGSFHDGYFNIRPDSPLIPRGGPNGLGQRTYVGASTVGDLIIVQPISANEAHVEIRLCEQRSLIMPGRNVIQAYIDVGRGIILKGRPNCTTDEVTAANLMVYLGPYRDYPGTQFPLSFTRPQDIVPDVCSGGSSYWP